MSPVREKDSAGLAVQGTDGCVTNPRVDYNLTKGLNMWTDLIGSELVLPMLPGLFRGEGKSSSLVLVDQ